VPQVETARKMNQFKSMIQDAKSCRIARLFVVGQRNLMMDIGQMEFVVLLSGFLLLEHVYGARR
jgi:hypothetical protein